MAVNYVKGGKVVEIKERHLAKIFADWDSVFPKGVEDPTKDAEELRKECRELLRRKGKIYGVFFKKRLVGVYDTDCKK